MLVRLLAVLLIVTAPLAIRASGPYSPPRVDPHRDDVYDEGKNLFWNSAAGQKVSCASCHTGKDSLSRARLAKVKYNLETRVGECAMSPDRANSKFDDKQMEALVHYLAKRYRL
jgi:hypothetical protein